jgi:hypothetical protein
MHRHRHRPYRASICWDENVLFSLLVDADATTPWVYHAMLDWAAAATAVALYIGLDDSKEEFLLRPPPPKKAFFPTINMTPITSCYRVFSCTFFLTGWSRLVQYTKKTTSILVTMMMNDECFFYLTRVVSYLLCGEVACAAVYNRQWPSYRPNDNGGGTTTQEKEASL